MLGLIVSLNAEPRNMVFVFFPLFLSLLMFLSTGILQSRKDISHMENPRKRKCPVFCHLQSFSLSLSLSLFLSLVASYSFFQLMQAQE